VFPKGIEKRREDEVFYSSDTKIKTKTWGNINGRKAETALPCPVKTTYEVPR